MKKLFLILFLVNSILFTNISSVFSHPNTAEKDIYSSIKYPHDEDFARLKNIIETKFFHSTNKDHVFRSNCLLNGQLCPNVFYSEEDRTALKMLIHKHADNYTDFFIRLFDGKNSFLTDNVLSKTPATERIISNLPITIQWRHNDHLPIVSDIFSRSFYQVDSVQSDIVSTLKNRVKQIAWDKCVDENTSNNDVWDRCQDATLNAKYLPRPDDFWNDVIFNGSNSVSISEFRDIVNYDVHDNGFTLSYKQDEYDLKSAKEHVQKRLVDTTGFTKKDYSSLIDAQKPIEIPEILQNLPNDQMVIYVKNPKHFFEILKPSKSVVANTFGINIAPKVTAFFEKFLQKNIDEIAKNITEPFVILVDDANFVAPTFTLVFDEKDGKNFANTKSFQKWNIITNSPEFTEFSPEKTLQNSSDFRFAWQKKSEKIKDIWVFVGDAFFEKIISFDNFTKTARTIYLENDIEQLQELSNAYKLAFWRHPNTLDDIKKVVWSEPLTVNYKEEKYNLSEGRVNSSLKNVTNLTQDELNVYVFMRKWYSQIWRSTLDPMMMVINKYGDGVDLDFVMIPAPSFKGTSLEIFENIFKNATRSEIAFLKNNTINKGFFSIVLNADIKKIEEKFQKETQEIQNELKLPAKLSEIINGEIALVMNNIEDTTPGINLLIGKHNAFSLENIKSKLQETPFGEQLFTHSETHNGRTIYSNKIHDSAPQTFISENDDYFLVSLSKENLVTFLDASKNDFHTFPLPEIEKNTFLGAYFQEHVLRENVQKYLQSLQNNENGTLWVKRSFARFVKNEIINFVARKQKNPQETLEINFGTIRIFEENGKIFLQDTWEKTEINFTEFDNILLEEKAIDMLKGLVESNQTLLDNFFFSLHFGDDEIGFTLRIASNVDNDENEKQSEKSSEKTQPFSPLLIIASISVIFIFITSIMYIKKKQKSTK